MSRCRRLAVAAMLTAVMTFVSGCSHLPSWHWPWHRKPAAPPPEVHELLITTPEGADAAFPQYWHGNTLIIDLKSASGSGSVILKPREHTLWPVRIGFRVMPGQLGQLEVAARQRVVLPVTPAGTKPIELELDPGVFIMKSPQITVTWGPLYTSSGE